MATKMRHWEDRTSGISNFEIGKIAAENKDHLIEVKLTSRDKTCIFDLKIIVGGKTVKDHTYTLKEDESVFVAVQEGQDVAIDGRLRAKHMPIAVSGSVDVYDHEIEHA